ncbi:hypothetical protein [Amycolatopsis sp. CA-230715]|uniref:hypothetical protein n=1 Tax=Amycolatopsis sp. CA-230715 TaxID=2745196 RepID=UPI001C01200A|nr:hypothetical protein [Amycolatopsis sp. CA-230715]QWF83284.1 hypothetical protein HUW46_06724 [Amycolatopsis sp. CA-230715]
METATSPAVRGVPTELTREEVRERMRFLLRMFANERHSLGLALDGLLADLDDLVMLTEWHSFQDDHDRLAAIGRARQLRDSTLLQLTEAYAQHPEYPWC